MVRLVRVLCFFSLLRKYFFPDSNPTVQLINTAGIFAVGFLMRPIGGYIFGKLADTKGRKAVDDIVGPANVASARY
jgi:MFS family permease